MQEPRPGKPCRNLWGSGTQATVEFFEHGTVDPCRTVAAGHLFLAAVRVNDVVGGALGRHRSGPVDQLVDVRWLYPSRAAFECRTAHVEHRGIVPKADHQKSSVGALRQSVLQEQRLIFRDDLHLQAIERSLVVLIEGPP